MDFTAPISRKVYTGRQADRQWLDWCTATIAPTGKRVVDIGCGGGIFSAGFMALGAHSVTGIDQSRQYIDDARKEYNNQIELKFLIADATHTTLTSNCADIMFERALIHHLSNKEQQDNALEAYRLLDNGGLLVVQDRTIDDVLDKNPDTWIRATLIEAFPRLIEFEKQRRSSRESYTQILQQAGFSKVKTQTLMEVRKHYASFTDLKQEILSRKGKSILFELDDQELQHYCALLEEKSKSSRLIECDSWTVWMATKT